MHTLYNHKNEFYMATYGLVDEKMPMRWVQ